MITHTARLSSFLTMMGLTLGLCWNSERMLLGSEETDARGVAPTDLRQVILTPGKTSEVIFPSSPAHAHEEVSYHVADYSAKVILSGTVDRDVSGKVKIPLTLPTGYYSLTLSGQESFLGLICQPEIMTRDPFFSIDAAMSWLAPLKMRAGLIANLRRLGMSMVRERMAWRQINPAMEEWDWESPKKYESTRRLYHASELPVLEMFHDAPRWTWAHATTGGNVSGDCKYPDDLQSTVYSWQRISEQYHTFWGALEAWNEPDISFGGNLPADQYLPVLKTLRYALSESKVTVPLGGGVFAYYNPPFMDLAARNGLLSECNFVSFHYYQDALGIQDRVKKIRDWLTRYGDPSKPLWITEIGCPITTQPNASSSWAEQRQSAAEFAMKTVEARACGIANYFAFVYEAYHERDKSFGMLDHRGTPLPSMAAYATVARLLGGSRYLGDVTGLNPSVQRARVFTLPDGEALVVVATGKVQMGATVKMPCAVKAVYGIDGRDLVVGEGENIPLEDGLAYVRVKPEALAAVLDTKTLAAELFAISQKKSPPMKPASCIVLQSLMDPESVQATSLGYMLSEITKLYPLSLKVNNLSDQERKVALTVADGEKISVAVEPHSSVIVERKIDVATLPVDEFGSNILTVTATSASSDEAPIAPIALALVLPRGLDTCLKASTYHFALPIAELTRWEKNSAGKIEWLQTPEVPLGYKTDISASDKWAFPKFSLPQEVDRNKVDAVAVRIRVAKEAIVRLATWDDNGTFHHTPYSIVPADGQWHVAHVVLQSFLSASSGKPMIGSQVSIGINSKDAENKVEISDFYLLGGNGELGIKK